MKHLLWKLLLLTLVSPAFSQTEPKDADSSPFNGIRVLGSDESKPTELGGTLRVGIYGAPGTTFLSEYNNSPDTALGKVSLFLNGIQMEKLRPVVLGPETDWDQMLNSEIRAADEKVKRDTIEGVAKDADQKAFKAKADAKTKSTKTKTLQKKLNKKPAKRKKRLRKQLTKWQSLRRIKSPLLSKRASPQVLYWSCSIDWSAIPMTRTAEQTGIFCSGR